MKHFKKIALVLCIPLFLTGCEQIPTLSNGMEVIAEIDGKQFTAEDLYSAMRDNYGTGVLVDLVNTYIADTSLTEEEVNKATSNAEYLYESYYAAYSTDWASFLSDNGFSSEDDFKEILISGEKQQLALEKYISSSVITEEEINEEYEENIYGEVTVRHILIQPEVTDDMTGTEIEEAEEKALNEAKALIEELNKSENLEEDFSNKATEVTDDEGSKATGGLYENFTNQSGFVEEFWEASLNLETSKMTQEPVETEHGYHIIYKVGQNDKPSLDSVRNSIVEDLVSEVLSETDAYMVYWAAFREQQGFKIYDTEIKDTYEFSLDSVN